MKYTIPLMIALLVTYLNLNAQTNLVAIPSSDTLYISDIKTTHLLLHESIQYVDVGSPYFVADTLQKMIRLKHTGEGLTDPKNLETNLTVISKKGEYYSWIMRYNHVSPLLNYEVNQSQQIIPSHKENASLENEKENFITQLCNTVLNQESNVTIKNKPSEDLEIKVTGIYYINEKIALKLILSNDSGIDFDIDQVIFRSKLDKKMSSDYLYQERIITPIKTCSDIMEIKGKKQLGLTFIFDKFMINKKEKFYVDVIELNGGRSASIRIPRKKLLEPKIL